MVTQGRELRAADIDLIQGLMAEHPDWGRTRLSEELCRRWDWRNAQGRFKDMAARTLLLKLERGGLIRLPRRQRPSSNWLRNRQAPLVAHATEPIRDALGDLRPLRLSVVESGSADLQLFNWMKTSLDKAKIIHQDQALCRVLISGTGLSPRVRGNPAEILVKFHEHGSIPACAGEPDYFTGQRRPPRVYPRVCGGTA